MKLERSFLHVGILAIPVSGLIFSLASFGPGVLINPASDPEGFARAAVTPAYAAANLAGLVGVVVFFFGFQAFREYMSDTPVRRWAFLGMVSSTAGMGLYLPFLGIFTFAGPAAARLYLSGDQQAIAVVVDSVRPSNPTALIFGGLSILLFVAGSIIFTGCIWQCGKLPKWSGVPYAIAAPSIIPVYSFLVAFLGSIVLLSSGVLIAMSVWKDNTRSGRQTPMAMD